MKIVAECWAKHWFLLFTAHAILGEMLTCPRATLSPLQSTSCVLDRPCCGGVLILTAGATPLDGSPCGAVPKFC